MARIESEMSSHTLCRELIHSESEAGRNHIRSYAVVQSISGGDGRERPGIVAKVRDITEMDGGDFAM